MRRLAWVLAMIIALGVMVGLPLLALSSQRVHYVDSVRIVTGPGEQRLECVCLDGVLTTCLQPP
jgi:cytochrome c-type biogenesis protein CcmE